MKSQSAIFWRSVCLAVAAVIIYLTFSRGYMSALSGYTVNVALYIANLVVAVGLVVLAIYFGTKAKK